MSTSVGSILLVGLTAWAYYPSLGGEFLLDDKVLVTESEFVRGPNGLKRIWLSTDPPDYWPLTNTAFWLQWRAWGPNTIGYHATNVALHVAAAFLLWAILAKLAIPGAYLAALLFAVHPVNVESVAWISQLKNTLAMVFFLLSIWWYLRAEEGRGKLEVEKSKRGEEQTGRVGLWYGLSLLAFVLAMLGKGSVAMLPVGLLLIVWWQRRRIAWADILRTVPFFAVAIALTAVNLWFQTHGKNIVVRDVTFAQRLAGAGAVVWFYLAKALVPIDLAFVYPNWRIQASDSFVVAAAGDHRRRDGCALAAAKFARIEVDAAVVVRLGDFLRIAAACARLCGRGLHEAFAGGRSL